PELVVVRGSRCPAAGPVPVPEAAVHQNDLLVPWQDDIRASGKTGIVEAEAEAHLMKQGPNPRLGLGILALDPRHSFASFFLRHDVRHCNLHGFGNGREERGRGTRHISRPRPGLDPFPFPSDAKPRPYPSPPFARGMNTVADNPNTPATRCI